MLAIHDVAKSYRRGAVHALRGITFECGPGIVGLLGPNGAGKSTLLRILATLSTATAGVVRWNGAEVNTDPERVRQVLGYLPQDFGVYPNLSAVEFLELIAAVKGLDRASARARVSELLLALNLHNVAKRALGGYSGGMRQRVGIAQALLNDPQLLILDEPTAGLDPEERARFRDMLTELARDRVVIVSTHVVSDIEFAANTIAIISAGRLLAYDTREVLCRKHQANVQTSQPVSLEEVYLAYMKRSAQAAA